MTDNQLRNRFIYVALALLNAFATALAAGVAAGIVPGFGETQYLYPAKEGVASALALLISGLTLWLAANRPRLGSEELAAQVDKATKTTGAKKKDLKVVLK